MRIAFMGTPDFSVAALMALRGAGHDLVAVYSQPPRPAGRGKKDRLSPVHEYAVKNNIPVYTPFNFKDASERQKFKNMDCDIAVVAAYGLILPQEILDTPNNGCLNIHASLLPRWRGAAPIQRAIMAGDTESGICIMQMEAGLDTGPVLLEKRIPVCPSDTAGSLHDKLSRLGAHAIVEALSNLDILPSKPQDSQNVTYAKKIDKAESHINWSMSALHLKNHIHGLSPFPGAWTEINGERLKILQVEISPQSGKRGTMIGAPLVIACGDQSLSVIRAQRAGKGAMDVTALMNGLDISIGTQFL